MLGRPPSMPTTPPGNATHCHGGDRPGGEGDATAGAIRRSEWPTDRPPRAVSAFSPPGPALSI